MRHNIVAAAKAYTPMIKFVGGRHPVLAHSEAMKVHPCALNGLTPGSKECVPVADFLSKLRPFKVVPYSNTSKSKSAKAPGSASNASAKSKYTFVNRPLEDNEVSSISQLPARFRFKPIDDLESEAINNGGAL